MAGETLRVSPVILILTSSTKTKPAVAGFSLSVFFGLTAVSLH